MNGHSIDRLRAMMLIRTFEEALSRRPDQGFQLLSTGQEAVAVGLCEALRPEDQLLTGGRAIGAILARGLEPHLVMAELLGRDSGPNQGRAGRGHFSDPEHGFFGAHAVVGGNLSIAAGVAIARKLSSEPGLVAVMFGDGAAGAGVFHETLNIASLWQLPLLFVCDNNQISVSTPRSEAIAAKRLSDLARSHGVHAEVVDGMNIEAVADVIGAATARVRAGAGPAFVECQSERLGPHSTRARESRSPEMLATIRAHCPIARLIADLKARGLLTDGSCERIQAEVDEVVADAIAFADRSPFPKPAEALADVW